MRRFLLGCLIFFIIPTPLLAETTLPLSNTQIQLLKKTLATEDENTPLQWNGNPITITLPMGQEKRLVFPEPIQADLNGSLTTDELRIINNEQSLYLTAQKTFSTSRMYVTLKNSHEIILLDLTTSPDASNNTRSIILSPKKVTVNSAAEAKQPSEIRINQDNERTAASADDYVNAMRFAWQQLYAPERLMPKDSNFSRTPMHTDKWVASLVYGDKVLAHPISSWLNNGIYITAVELRNKYSHPTPINLLQDICGEWQAASIYPRHVLKPAGDKSGDSAMVFLISAKPFGEVLQVCHGSA